MTRFDKTTYELRDDLDFEYHWSYSIKNGSNLILKPYKGISVVIKKIILVKEKPIYDFNK